MRYLGILLAVVAAPVWAQVTIEEVVRRSGERYAGVQISIEQASLAAAAVQQARLAYLPRGDFYAQANLATRNNVYGMLMPNRVIPPISGPPSATNAGTNVFGSAVGFLVTWEPFDFGQRKAHVATMDAGQQRAVRGVRQVVAHAEDVPVGWRKVLGTAGQKQSAHGGQSGNDGVAPSDKLVGVHVISQRSWRASGA